MYNIQLPVATRASIAQQAGGQHKLILGVFVAILAAVPRSKSYQIFKIV